MFDWSTEDGPPEQNTVTVPDQDFKTQVVRGSDNERTTESKSGHFTRVLSIIVDGDSYQHPIYVFLIILPNPAEFTN